MRVKRNGFTLIELGVLLAVLAMGMAYIAPDFMEQARGDLAVRTAKELAAITDAGKWFYLNEGGDPADRDDMRWPGEAAGALCIGAGSAQGELIARGYLEAPDFTNPWGRGYDVSIRSPDGVPNHCTLVIATDVPSTVAAEVTSFMPMTTCVGCPGAAAGGFTRCCAKIVRPGQEMILQEWIDPGNMCDIMKGGRTDAGTGKCDVRAKWSLSSCYYTKPGVTESCREGYVAIGNKQINCGKYCEQTILKCCRGQ